MVFVHMRGDGGREGGGREGGQPSRGRDFNHIIICTPRMYVSSDTPKLTKRLQQMGNIICKP